mgnify:FL=1
MNKYGITSILIFISSVAFFYITRGPNSNILLAVYVLGVLFIIGIILAILSKKLPYIIVGVTLNSLPLVFAMLLFFAWSIGEP